MPGPLPNPRDEVKNLARIKAAFRFADERRLDEAIAALRSLLQENPKLLDVWSKLGEVLVESGRYDEAIEAYRSAIAHAERFSPDLALALGFAHLKHGETAPRPRPMPASPSQPVPAKRTSSSPGSRSKRGASTPRRST